MKILLLLFTLISTANAYEGYYGYPPGYYNPPTYPQMYYQISPYGFTFSYDYRPVQPIIVYPQCREIIEPRWSHELNHHQRHHREFR